MSDTEVRVRGPLPFDVAGTLVNAIGKLYPGALLGSSNDPRDAIVIVIPDSERPGLPLPDGEVALDVISISPQGLQAMTPVELIAPLAAWVDQRFEETGAENYIEQTVSLRDARHRYVLNFRRVEGKTPHELRRAAEAEAEQLRAENEALKSQLAALRRDTLLEAAEAVEPEEIVDWEEVTEPAGRRHAAEQLQEMADTTVVPSVDAYRASVIEELADRAAEVIANGDVAEVAAPSGVPEVGRGSAVDARDDLHEDPAGWIRAQARPRQEVSE